MSRSRPLLDACLIVRDEEVNLPDCLASLQRLRPLLNRICIYDTGSIDGTIQLARAAGAHVQEGYWDDDFARARNASLAMSKARWALLIDADERVVADTRTLERRLSASNNANVIDAELYHLDENAVRIGSSRYIKAVRPDAVRFAHPIHEIVTGISGRAIGITSLSADVLHFDHLGYSSAAVRRAKAVRNESVADAALHVALQAGDTVRIAHAYQHRGRSRTLLGRHGEALADLKAAWASWEEGSVNWRRAARDVVRLALTARDTAEATAVLRVLEASGEDPDLCRALLAEILVVLGHFEAALRVTEDLVPHGEPIPEALGTLAAREVLDTRVQALEALERWPEMLATLLTLVSWGGTERIPLVVRMWRNDARTLADILAEPGHGPHGMAIVEALRACGGVGADAAVHVEESRRASALARTGAQGG